MTDEPQMDLRALGDVDEPEVVREALRRFRRRLLTRYAWGVVAAIAIVLAIVWGGRPSTLAEEMESAHVRVFPEVTWRVGDENIALDEVADLGDDLGLHFVIVPDPGTELVGVQVEGEIHSFSIGAVTSEYVRVEKSSARDGILSAAVGGIGCIPPGCPPARSFDIDLHGVVPADVWRTS